MGTWKCPACDSYNPDSVDECLTCGATRKGLKDVIDGTPREVLVTCSVCGGNNALSRTICQWCGAPLPVGPGGDAGDATNPMLEPPGAVVDGRPTVEEMPAIEELDAVVLDEDGPTAPSLQAAVGRAAAPAAPRPAAESRSGVRRSPEARNCFTCGISLEPDEWVLVAGPRILCRACFHEEFGSKKEQQAGAPPGGETGLAGASIDESVVEPPSKQGMGWLLWGGILTVLGLVVSFLWGFVWGFTPVAGGLILAGIGLVQWLSGRRPAGGSGGAKTGRDRAGASFPS